VSPGSGAFDEAVAVAMRLSTVDRLRLIEHVAATLEEEARTGAETTGLSDSSGQQSLRGLRGLGKEIWQGQDSQGYVDDLRDEWSP